MNDLVAVSGLWRCGSSLMMQILSKGGRNPIVDPIFNFDEFNENGYYEINEEHAEIVYHDMLRSEENFGCIKILAPFLEYNKIINLCDYVIWMKRDIDEIILSTKKKFGLTPYPRKLRLMERDALALLRKKTFDPIIVNYNELVKGSLKELNKIRPLVSSFESASLAIDEKLYRCRNGKKMVLRN